MKNNNTCTTNKHNSILNNSMATGLQINLKDAIEDVGGKVPSSACLWQYPEIIRNQLINKTITKVNILGKDIINISENTDDSSYIISTLYDTSNVNRPNYAVNNDSWGEVTSVDKVFTDLFDNVLPMVKGVHAGDMTVTDGSGNDTKQWNNTLFNTTGNKTGLQASSKYLRLYLTCQEEPLYIFIDGAVNDLTGGYNIVSSNTVQFELDDNNMTLTAHINCITKEQINSIQ